MRVPDRLQWLERLPGGPEWLASLPALVDRCCDAWELRRPLEPLPSGYVSFVAASALPDGSEVVLKLPFPDEETRPEPLALAAWAGHGAVELLAHDHGSGGLLLARCRPGGQLLEQGEEEALRVTGRLLRRLHAAPVPDGSFPRLPDAVPEWMEQVERRWRAHGRPIPRALLDEAEEAVEWLLADPAPERLLHQDLHAANVIRSGNEWLAIDPKPIVGDPALDLASAVRDRRPWLLVQPDARAILQRRLDVLSDVAGVDRDRAAAWALVHALAWGMDDGARYDDVLACAVLLGSPRTRG